MTASLWESIAEAPERIDQPAWLEGMLARNANCAYLRAYGSPATAATFRERVPTTRYEDLAEHIERIRDGESDVLFAGRPVAFERTGGSGGGAKLIPYSADGLADFQREVVPWLARTVREHGISGRAYFSISPATRQAERVGDVPVGLPDAAYLGERAGHVLAAMSAVSLSVAAIDDIAAWRKRTVADLRAAGDLEFISVWSPTFLLRLLDDIPDPLRCWPRLKLVSCWASAGAARYAGELRRRLPGVALQPKGLLSTEAVVTVPNADGQLVPASHVFVEYLTDGRLLPENQLEIGGEYEIVVTTASGLYRYCTGDRVRVREWSHHGRAVLDFVGRGGLACDLVGEKLTEAFVSDCLASVAGAAFAMLVPDASRPGYVVLGAGEFSEDELVRLEAALCANPQYAYARKLEQLAPLRAVTHPRAFALVEQAVVARGSRLGDVKPLALRTEDFWIPYFEAAA